MEISAVTPRTRFDSLKLATDFAGFGFARVSERSDSSDTCSLRAIKDLGIGIFGAAAIGNPTLTSNPGRLRTHNAMRIVRNVGHANWETSHRLRCRFDSKPFDSAPRRLI